MDVTVRPVRPDEREAAARLRCALYTACSFGESLAEVDACLRGGLLGGLPWTLLAAECEERPGELVGFAEVSLRSVAEGCDTSQPVGYLEGWWVAPEFRRRGIGRALVDAALAWARANGAAEFASDAEPDNEESLRAHHALGFEECGRSVHLRRAVAPGDDAVAAARGIRGRVADLYDVFVDWPGRLARELPGLVARLRAAGARRVLDVGCGTGRHVHALRAEGFDAHGADPSPDMLGQARTLLGGDAGLHAWAFGDDVTAALRAAAPFDAVIALGNVWPQVLGEDEARRAAAAARELLRPGGTLLLGLKALGVRAASGNPYMPLLVREHEGRRLAFVRFVEFDLPRAPDGVRLARFHMLVAGAEPPLERVGTTRVWEPDELRDWWRARGFEDVQLSAGLGAPDTPPPGEDVFLQARAPS